MSKGPHDEEASTAEDVTLTPKEIEQVRAKKATAAIFVLSHQNDWTTAQVKALRTQFAELGIEVIAESDANFNAAKQSSDVETVLQKDPDIIVAIPVDEVATAPAFKKAAAQGVKIVFMDNVPKGMVAGKDYVSVVAADNYGNGAATAHQLAQMTNKRAKVLAVTFAVDFYVTNARYDGFKETLSSTYPDIQIVDEQGMTGPDIAGNSEKAAAAMLAKHRDADFIWTIWDVPADGVQAAQRAAGTDIPILTQDLGQTVAISMAKNGLVKGLGAQRPYDQGLVEAKLAGYSLIGKKAPPFVALYPLAVSRSNLLDSWRTVYHEEAPKEVKDGFGG